MLLRRYKHICCTGFLPFLLLFVYSCKKDDPGKKNSFSWVHNGISHTTTMDIAFTSLSGLPSFTIIAGEKRTGYNFYTRVEFHLTAFREGIYWVNDGSGQYNRLTYTDDAGIIIIGAGGSFTITKNSNNYLSGNFSATLITGAGATSQLTGSFTNMPVR